MKKRKRKNPHKELLKQARPHYERLLEEQGGVCAICGRPPQTRRLHIDHDHKTMRVRGLLCFRCNAALRGYMTVEWLQAAARYLKRKPIDFN